MDCPRIPRSWFFFLSLGFVAPIYPHPPALQALTAVPAGPLHVDRNRLVDSQGRAFLIRGTELPEFRTRPPVRPGESAPAFGPHSATVFSTIRQRWNMNAVRLPLNLTDYEGDPRYLQAADQVVRRANDLELLVILAAREPRQSLDQPSLIRFWRDCAAHFRDYPGVIFELDAGQRVGTQDLIQAVRAAGARQPVLVDGSDQRLVDDVNAIYAVYPQYKTARTDEDRDRQFGQLAERVPVLASGFDPQLDADSAECASLPADPSQAEAVVQANLDYFDSHRISWVASEFRPGKLIRDYRLQFATSLENGWTCGQPEYSPFGIGEVVQFHLWGGELRGLFAVNAAGNFTLARGSVAIVYGGIFAEADTHSRRTPPPTELGRVSLLVTDSAGISRSAGLLFVSAGWGQANFIVPSACAPGPARVTVARRDGTSASTPVVIADVAPGIWAATGDGRGPVIGFVTHRSPGQTRPRTPVYYCDSQGCSTIPITLSARSVTNVQLLGTGFRNAATLSDIRVTIGGIRVPVTAFGPAAEAGVDQLTIPIPWALRHLGEADLVCSVRGSLSNVVRINIGPAGRAQ